MKRTVYYGGDILTLEGGGRAEALLVEDGVIRELGTKEASPPARRPSDSYPSRGAGRSRRWSNGSRTTGKRAG